MNMNLTVSGVFDEDPALKAIVATLHGIAAGAPETPAAKIAAAPPVREAEPEPQPETQPASVPVLEAEPAPERKTVDFETVRAAAAAAMNGGDEKRGKVREILAAHGGRLSDMPATEWPAVLAEIEAL